jgi:hypothetical protein
VAHAGFGADDPEIVCDHHVAVKARLVAILHDVVAPHDTAGVLVQGVELAGARANEEKLARDLGCGVDSAAAVERPQNGGFSLAERRSIRLRGHHGCRCTYQN